MKQLIYRKSSFFKIFNRCSRSLKFNLGKKSLVYIKATFFPLFSVSKIYIAYNI